MPLIPRPYALLAELTHSCPLQCVYCSNPVDLVPAIAELPTESWLRVINQAASLGVLQIHLSGGEPLARSDLPSLVRAARLAGTYTNLITSGIGMTPRRAEALRAAGLDSVQLSFQGDTAEGDSVAGISAHESKLAAAKLVRSLAWPLTVNVVLHRQNIDRVGAIIAFAEELDAQKIELAHTQYYGWAFANRARLLPTREQAEQAGRIAAAAAERLRGQIEVTYVLPDYLGERPKPCMHGWGRRSLTVDPRGQVLPCPTAGSIPGMLFDNVVDHSLEWIWRESESFNRYRGYEWMSEPCRSCDLREIDFGGCRCQAALLTGNAANTDPACSLSPYRETLTSSLTVHGLPLVRRSSVP